MPCYDARDTWSAEHSHQAAHLLCGLLKNMLSTSPLWTPELRAWLADHQDMDAFYERKSRERR